MSDHRPTLIEWCVVEAVTGPDLEREVNELLQRGWVTTGNVVASVYGTLVQAMYRNLPR
jgi:tRNA(Met) C34 N-acetyltransferase TmcA